MAASSIKIVGSEVSYNINDLNGASQQIPIPATTAGSTLVVCVSMNQTNATTLSSVTDSASNTYTQRNTSISGTGTTHIRTLIYTADNATSATWIKVTTSASCTMVCVSFLEISGCTTAATDVTNGGTATASTSVTATNTPGTAGDIILFYAATGGQSLTHVQDGTTNIDRVAAPYPTGTAGSGAVSSLQAFNGAPGSIPLTTAWTSASSANFAWSSVSLKASTPATGGLYLVNQNNPVSAADLNQFVNLLNGTTTDTPVKVANRIQASMTGATAQSGYVGSTTSGAPTSGTFLTGDWINSQDGCFYICTTGGTPGTWSRVGNGNYIGRAYQTNVQNFTGSASLFAVTTDTTSFDPRSMWTGASNGFTIPFSGSRWRIIAGQHITTSTSGRFYVSITKNGTEISRGYDGPTASNNAGGIVSDIQQFNSGDIIRAAILSTATGSTVTGSANNYLCVALADG